MDSINRPRLAAEAQFKVIDGCNIDGVETMWDWLLPAEAMGCEVKIPEHGTIPTISHVVHDATDLDKLEIPEVRNFYRLKGARETTRIMAETIGNERFLMASLLSPFTLAGELRGVEDMMMDCLLEEGFVHDLLDMSLEVNRTFMDDMVTWEMDAVILCDPTASGDLISADDYAKFSKSPLKALGDAVRKGGKIQMNHICGDTFDRLEIVAETGCKAYSVDYQVNIAAAVEKMKGRMAIIGNINPAQILYSGTPSDVRAATSEVLKQGGKCGYMLGSGCDIPVGTAYENVRAMSDEFMKF